MLSLGKCCRHLAKWKKLFAMCYSCQCFPRYRRGIVIRPASSRICRKRLNHIRRSENFCGRFKDFRHFQHLHIPGFRKPYKTLRRRKLHLRRGGKGGGVRTPCTLPVDPPLSLNRIILGLNRIQAANCR